MLGEALPLVPLTAVAAGVIGGFAGSASPIAASARRAITVPGRSPPRSASV